LSSRTPRARSISFRTSSRSLDGRRPADRALGLWLTVRLIPHEILEEARARADVELRAANERCSWVFRGGRVGRGPAPGDCPGSPYP
jgi:hypothetical protein